MFLNYLTSMCSETLMQHQEYIISGDLGSIVIYKQRFITPNPQTSGSFITIFDENQQKLVDLGVETEFTLKANTYVCKIDYNTKDWYKLKKDVPIKIICAICLINRNNDYLFAFQNPGYFQINIINGANTRINLSHEMLVQKVEINTSFQIFNDEVNQTHTAQNLMFQPQGIHLLQRNGTDQQFSLSQPFELVNNEVNLRNYRVASTQKHLLSLRALNAFIMNAKDGTEEFKARFNFAFNNQIKLLTDVDADRVDSKEMERVISNKSKKVFRRIYRWNAVVDNYLSNDMTKDEFISLWNDNYNLIGVVLENHQRAVHDMKDVKEVMKYLLHVPYLLSFYGDKYLHEFKGLDGEDGKIIYTAQFFNTNFLEKWREELKDVSASDVKVTNIFVVVLSEALNFVTNLTKNRTMFEWIFFNNVGMVDDILKSIVETAIEYFDNVDESTQKKVHYFIEKAKIIFENNIIYLENKQPNEEEHASFVKEVTKLNGEVQSHLKIVEEKKIEKRKKKKVAPIEKCEKQTELIQKTITTQKTNIESLENKLLAGKEFYTECEAIKEVLNKVEKDKIDALSAEITNLEEYIEKVKKKKVEEPEDLVEEEEEEEEGVSEDSVTKEEEEEDILQYVNVKLGDDKEKDKTLDIKTKDKIKDTKDKKDKDKTKDTKDKDKTRDTEDKIKKDKGASTWIIVVFVISSIVALVGICICVWYFYVKKRNTPEIEIEQPFSNKKLNKRPNFNTRQSIKPLTSGELPRINVKPIYRNNY